MLDSKIAWHPQASSALEVSSKTTSRRSWQGTWAFEDEAIEDSESNDLTNALAELRLGEPGALDRVVPMLYGDLRRLARQRLQNERGQHTLGTTGVVHETYLRLLGERKLTANDRGEFLAAASNAMRRLLVDYARTKRRKKRGGGVAPVPIESVAPFLSDRASQEMIELDDALRCLGRVLPRAARVFELKAFGGLSLKEVADLHETSTKTVQRDWIAARAWLRKEVRPDVAGEVRELPDDQDGDDQGGNAELREDPVFRTEASC